MSTTSGSGWRIRLFGDLDLRDGAAAPLRLGSARAETLLAYLLLHRDAPQSRQRVAYLLWPDSTDGQARTNLRHLLHVLRTALPGLEELVDIGPTSLHIREQAHLWLDVAEYEAAADRAETVSGDDQVAELEAAAALYRQDLLPALYDDWVDVERARLRARQQQVLGRLVSRYAEAGGHAAAVAAATRLIALDPLREEPYRILIGLHDAAGDRARALQTFHTCAEVLEREVGVPPSAATRRLYDQLLAASTADQHVATRSDRGARVGRREEWGRLLDLWAQAERGPPRLVVVSGEAGIGKTRLVEDLAAWCAHRRAVVAHARSYAAEGGMVLAPVVSWLRSPGIRDVVAGLEPAATAELARLVPEVAHADPPLPAPAPVPDEERRRRLFDAVDRALRAVGRPLLLVADDLQWADPATCEFLHYVLRQDTPTPLLAVATLRAEDRWERPAVEDLLCGLQRLGRLEELPLSPLSPAETGLLAARAGGRALPSDAAGRLFAHTEGNPLFVIEAVRAGWPDQAGAPASTPRVQAVIEHRLRQLSDPARLLLGLAATIGGAFDPDLLAHVSGLEEDALLAALDELWRRRLLRERDHDSYDVSHDRIREVAYEALTPSRRRAQHRRIAEALATRPHARAGQGALPIARHFDLAGAPEAVDWYVRAAGRAHRLQASDEAVRLHRRALELLAQRPDTPERDAAELAVLTSLQSPLHMVEGPSSSWLARSQQRALALAEGLDVRPDAPLLGAVGMVGLAHGDLAAARRAGEALRTGGLAAGDRVRAVEGAYLLGIAAFWSGDFHAARGHFATAVAEHVPGDRSLHLQEYWLEPDLMCQGRLANTLWFLGAADEARRTAAAAVDAAAQTVHRDTVGAVATFAALLADDLRDESGFRHHAAVLIRQPDPMPANRAGARHHAAFLAVLDGDVDAGLRALRAGAAEADRSRLAPGLIVLATRYLLRACELAGHAEEGLSAADDRLARDADHLYTAEFRRQRGVFLHRLGGTRAEVDAAFRAALQLADGQGARSLALRSAVDLVRHRRARGPSREVRAAEQVLARVAGQVAAGGDTPEVRAARALLAEASPPARTAAER